MTTLKSVKTIKKDLHFKKAHFDNRQLLDWQLQDLRAEYFRRWLWGQAWDDSLHVRQEGRFLKHKGLEWAGDYLAAHLFSEGKRPHFGVSTSIKAGYVWVNAGRHQYDTNIKLACNLLLTHLKEEMKKYEEEIPNELAETVSIWW
jgi:hypothetical protein